MARLAALPATVIERAREILAVHEQVEETVVAPKQAPMQIRLFEPLTGDLAQRIRALKLDELRPIEALQILASLQKELQ